MNGGRPDVSRTMPAWDLMFVHLGYKYCNGRMQKQKHTGWPPGVVHGVAVTGPLRFICDELGRKKVCRPSENYNSALKVGGGPCGVF